MRKAGQGHNAALTTKVRVFDNVENPNTLEGRSAFGNGCLQGGWTQLTHSTPHLESKKCQSLIKALRCKNSPSLITTCTSPRLPCFQSTIDLYTVRVKTIESKITTPPHTKPKSITTNFSQGLSSWLENHAQNPLGDTVS